MLSYPVREHTLFSEGKSTHVKNVTLGLHLIKNSNVFNYAKCNLKVTFEKSTKIRKGTPAPGSKPLPLKDSLHIPLTTPNLTHFHFSSMTHIISQLKAYRDISQLTQETLAKKCGVSRKTINKLEQNGCSPSLVLAYKIAKIFHCAVEDVFIIKQQRN